MLAVDVRAALAQLEDLIAQRLDAPTLVL